MCIRDSIKAVQREAEGYQRRPDQTFLDKAADKVKDKTRELLPSPTSVGIGMGVVLVVVVGIIYLTRARA